jgi:alcohol dehydrogenase/S-(hydroxymethyl)glutathione dehydrogenase/alcohol dehydrogenase
MRAAVLHQYNQVPQVEDVDIKEPLTGEVLVRIAASGICGSDTTHCLPSPEDPKALVAEVKKILPRGVDVAFDAVGGAPDRLHHLMAATDLGGMTVAVGVLGWTDDVPVKGIDLLYGARRLVGVRGGNSSPRVDIKRTLNLYKTGRLKLDILVGEKFGLDEFDKAWAAAARADHARTILEITPGLL